MAMMEAAVRTPLPVLLTWARIALVPFVVIAFYLPVSWGRAGAAVLFIVASVTDWLDGYLARRFNQATAFGEFLDPVADKLMVAVTLVIVVEAGGREFGLPWSLPMTVGASIILARELVVSALRQWLAGEGAGSAVSVSDLAKFKTAAQMTALTLLLLVDRAGTALYWIGTAALLLAALLACLSMVGYLRALRPRD